MFGGVHSNQLFTSPIYVKLLRWLQASMSWSKQCPHVNWKPWVDHCKQRVRTIEDPMAFHTHRVRNHLSECSPWIEIKISTGLAGSKSEGLSCNRLLQDIYYMVQTCCKPVVVDLVHIEFAMTSCRWYHTCYETLKRRLMSGRLEFELVLRSLPRRSFCTPET